MKCENLQLTGAYKLRGALNKIISLNEVEKSRGVICSSAGNHAQGVAYASLLAGVNATIVMPETTPYLKVESTKNYGGNVILHGKCYDDAFMKAKSLEEEEKRVFIHPFDDMDVIYGQGTIALEIFEDINDFDYLIHNFYVVDKTTTITGEQLNASELLARDMRLAAPTGQPQILIYHTHSQEGYADSVPGDPNTTVVGVGNYLTELLQERYGLSVLHHTGEYDVNDRDHAYSNAEPAIEQILRENPSIEVVIDLHRDGVAEGTRLVTEVDGTRMASIMFFNGLSRTTALGDISYLKNPYIQDNLAFSFQMQLKAAEYYPGLARPIYLKGYRYNMHFKPKSLLIEVGAQTNTLQEAKNAMVPLADVLHRVIQE